MVLFELGFLILAGVIITLHVVNERIDSLGDSPSAHVFLKDHPIIKVRTRKQFEEEENTRFATIQSILDKYDVDDEDKLKVLREYFAIQRELVEYTASRIKHEIH